MSEPERFEVLILGSGFGGKLLAWHMAQSGRRTAVVERRWIGGSCPNIACLPSKNEIWSALMSAFTRRRQVNWWLASKRWFWALPGRAGGAVVETTVDHTLMRGSEPHDR
jgi:pyruvate/2-oxoglutarate dehydrogenase complex dihydrolipoamide dehydrogenase (E3) component